MEARALSGGGESGHARFTAVLRSVLFRMSSVLERPLYLAALGNPAIIVILLWHPTALPIPVPGLPIARERSNIRTASLVLISKEMALITLRAPCWLADGNAITPSPPTVTLHLKIN